MRPHYPTRRARGFTLVEAIIVIVITGIVASMVAIFIKAPVQSYVDSAARAELSDAADLILRRISRELRLALPNSIVVSDDRRSVMFLITKTGGRYIDVRDQPPPAVLPLSFTNPTARTFHMAGAAPTGRQAIVPGDFIVVYNLGQGQSPADAYNQQNAGLVTAVSGTQITMATNPFAVATPTMPSPTNRFQVVSGTVVYQCALPASGTGTLTRYTNNQVLQAVDVPGPLGVGALMSNAVATCQFDATQLPNIQTALITIKLKLQLPNGEAVELVRQVHVDNTP